MSEIKDDVCFLKLLRVVAEKVNVKNKRRELIGSPKEFKSSTEVSLKEFGTSKTINERGEKKSSFLLILNYKTKLSLLPDESVFYEADIVYSLEYRCPSNWTEEKLQEFIKSEEGRKEFLMQGFPVVSIYHKQLLEISGINQDAPLMMVDILPGVQT